MTQQRYEIYDTGEPFGIRIDGYDIKRAPMGCVVEVIRQQARDIESLRTELAAAIAERDQALAELERAAATPRLWLAEPVAGDYAGHFPVVADAPEKVTAYAASCHYAEFRAVPLYTAPPPAPVAEIREPTPEECERILDVWVGGSGEKGSAGRAMFNAVRAVMEGKS